eukprot:gene4876-34638_t
MCSLDVLKVGVAPPRKKAQQPDRGKHWAQRQATTCLRVSALSLGRGFAEADSQFTKEVLNIPLDFKKYPGGTPCLLISCSGVGIPLDFKEVPRGDTPCLNSCSGVGIPLDFKEVPRGDTPCLNSCSGVGIPLDFKEVPRGDTPCLNNCSGVGVCQFDIGLCYCPAGFGGDDCSQPRKRPCWRMGEDKRDLDWHKYTEWTHSRCAGICDDDVAMCAGICDDDVWHGTPPIKQGRPLYWCQPSNDKDGVPVKWGAVSFEDLFGESGWCNSAQSKFQCPCRRDGMLGQYLQHPDHVSMPLRRDACWVSIVRQVEQVCISTSA